MQAVSNELNGERIDIILWDDDPAKIVINALSPGEVDSITIDETEKSMDISVNKDQLAQVIGRGGQNIKLASELSGWKLNIIRSEDNKDNSSIEQLSNLLDIETEIATILVRENIDSIDKIVTGGQEKLANIDEFDEEIAEALLERAREVQLEMSLSGQTDTPETDLKNLSMLSEEQISTLLSHDIKTQNDLAELATDELQEILPLEEKAAQTLIMEARKPWFTNDEE